MILRDGCQSPSLFSSFLSSSSSFFSDFKMSLLSISKSSSHPSFQFLLTTYYVLCGTCRYFLAFPERRGGEKIMRSLCLASKTKTKKKHRTLWMDTRVERTEQHQQQRRRRRRRRRWLRPPGQEGVGRMRFSFFGGSSTRIQATSFLSHCQRRRRRRRRRRGGGRRSSFVNFSLGEATDDDEGEENLLSIT